MFLDIVFSGTDSEKWLVRQMQFLTALTTQSARLQAWRKLGREAELRFNRDTNEVRWRALLQSLGQTQKAWTETQKIASKMCGSAAEKPLPDDIQKFDFTPLYEVQKLQNEVEADASQWIHRLQTMVDTYKRAASDQCNDFHLPETSWKKQIPAEVSTDYRKVLSIAGKCLENLDGDGIDETLNKMLKASSV